MGAYPFEPLSDTYAGSPVWMVSVQDISPTAVEKWYTWIGMYKSKTQAVSYLGGKPIRDLYNRSAMCIIPKGSVNVKISVTSAHSNPDFCSIWVFTEDGKMLLGDNYGNRFNNHNDLLDYIYLSFCTTKEMSQLYYINALSSMIDDPTRYTVDAYLAGKLGLTNFELSIDGTANNGHGYDIEYQEEPFDVLMRGVYITARIGKYISKKSSSLNSFDNVWVASDEPQGQLWWQNEVNNFIAGGKEYAREFNYERSATVMKQVTCESVLPKSLVVLVDTSSWSYGTMMWSERFVGNIDWPPNAQDPDCYRLRSWRFRDTRWELDPGDVIARRRSLPDILPPVRKSPSALSVGENRLGQIIKVSNPNIVKRYSQKVVTHQKVSTPVKTPVTIKQAPVSVTAKQQRRPANSTTNKRVVKKKW